MKNLSVNEMETINGGGGFCTGVEITAALAGIGGYFGWIVVTPWGAGALIAISVACIASDIYENMRG